MEDYVDGFVKLHQAQLDEYTAYADVTNKLVQAEIGWQQAKKGALENLRLLLNIQWDAEAPSSSNTYANAIASA